ncbi:hypothetical protein Acr_22g0010020 [Actinidia rufa]|uniref:Uncharacterized protein n=1 Tax=Actinidia rufa TaxID=165716 RepID=A0A7J0GLP4_9ERIC|nr:hypothetical protein Acr_22g0010020 [Actinidia rufa]
MGENYMFNLKDRSRGRTKVMAGEGRGEGGVRVAVVGRGGNGDWLGERVAYMPEERRGVAIEGMEREDGVAMVAGKGRVAAVVAADERWLVAITAPVKRFLAAWWFESTVFH